MARCHLAFDLASAFDAALDQIPCRKAHVRLERLDARLLQPIAQRRNVGGNRDLHAADGRIIEGPSVNSPSFQFGGKLGALDIGVPDIKVGALPVVAREEGAAVLEPAI